MLTTAPSRPKAFPLQEYPAPPGWSAFLLVQVLPVDEPGERQAYAEAVGRLLALLPPFEKAHPEEVFLVFERCRPGREIKRLQENARLWMPQFGVGVWLHKEPPSTWSREEFEAATPGTLRPVIERVVRLQRDPQAQTSAWRILLGSGALLRVTAATAGTFVEGATELLQPTISDSSLTSFPFYVPLLRADTLRAPSPSYAWDLSEHLPSVDAYLRESVEDGGLLVVCRLPERSREETLEALSKMFAFQRLTPERGERQIPARVPSDAP